VKKWVAIGAVVLLIATIGFVAVILSRGDSDTGQINVYFFNPVAMQMEAEARPLPEGDLQLQGVISHLHSGPRTGILETTWPVELALEPNDLISAMKLEDMTLFAFLSPVFNEMTPLNQSLFKAAFIHTMSGLPSVSEIKIAVTGDYSSAIDAIMRDLLEDDEPEYVYDEYYTPYIPLVIYDNNHAGVLLEPLDPPISPRWIADYMFNNLHFVDATGTGLVVESYFAENIDRWPEPLAIYALYLLIDGPRYEDTLPLIPPETRILDLGIDGTDIYVNLSIEFVTRFAFPGNKELANLMIHSIVNTLIAEIHHPTRVFFLIETQQVEYFHGVEDFHTGFVRDDRLLLSYIEAIADEYATWDERE